MLSKLLGITSNDMLAPKTLQSLNGLLQAGNNKLILFFYHLRSMLMKNNSLPSFNAGPRRVSLKLKPEN